MKSRRSRNNFLGKKNEIIRVAAMNFAVKGYRATTIEDISKEVGVTPPTIYYYVKNKEAILNEINNAMMEVLEKVAKVGSSALPAKERLETMIRIILKYAAEFREITLIATEQNNALSKRSRKALKLRQKEVDGALQQTIEEGIKEGTFTAYNSRIVSFAISAAAIYVYHWYRPSGAFTPDQIADQLIDFLENGLVTCKSLKEHGT
jgi:AcrR family transcriptional regulator